MISDYEKTATAREFFAYCKRTLVNARTDVMREKEKSARRERLFSDMRDSELNQLASPRLEACPEVVFDANGKKIGVMDLDIANALYLLDGSERAIILLSYFADWSDGRIATDLGLPRSTVQFRRTHALRKLRSLLEEGGQHDCL